MTRFNLTLLSALLALGLGCGTEEDIQPVDGSDGIRVGEVDVSPQAPGQGPDVIPADDGAPNVVETPVEAPARGDEARDEVPPSDAPHGDQADPAPGGDSRGDGAGDRRAEDDAHDGQGHVRPHDGADDDMNPDQADDRPRDVPEGDVRGVGWHLRGVWARFYGIATSRGRSEETSRRGRDKLGEAKTAFDRFCNVELLASSS